MKLEELNIDAQHTGRSIQLGRFADGLTFVYGENSAGKSSARQLVRQTLFGSSHAALPNTARYDRHVLGNVTVAAKGARFQLERPSAQANRLEFRKLASTNPDSVSPNMAVSESDLSQGISASIYDTVYSVSFKETASNAPRLARTLHDTFQIGFGAAFAGDDSIHLARQRELESAQARMSSLQQQIADLQLRRAEQLEQSESEQLQWQRQLGFLDADVTATQTRLGQFHATPLIDELASVNTELEAVRLRIESAQAEVIYPTVEPALDHLATLYQRLDEIDNQIHRWRHLQADIQNQRLRLRDEMLVWNELTLDSDDHPYHLAREILVGLETKVDEAERNSQHWAAAGGARVDTDQMAKSLGELCQSMRDDLYGLCNELGHQYKHIRHRSAAAELKQLRRCYTEMGENIDRLVRRRATVVREIRELDPAGAEAIVRADNKFCQCAQHEGYLAARKRFVGTTFAQAPVRIEPDLSHERSRLAELELRRNELQGKIARIEQDSAEWNRKLVDLSRKRDEIVLKLNSVELPSVVAIDAEINSLYAQIQGLKDRSDLTLTMVKPHAVLQQASSLVRRMTDGSLLRVYLQETPGNLEPRWMVHDQHAHTIAFEQLDHDRQDQVYLALMLAAKDALLQRGIEMPTLIDDAFCRIAGERINPTLGLLDEWGQHGHQIVAFSQHRYLADRVPGVTVLSMDQPSTVAQPSLATPQLSQPSPISRPQSRQSRPQSAVTSRVQPVTPEAIRYGDNNWARQNMFDDVYIDDPANPPYPLSKYSRSEMTDHGDYDLDQRYQETVADISPKIYPLPFGETRTTSDVRPAQPIRPNDETRWPSNARPSSSLSARHETTRSYAETRQPYAPVSVESIGEPIQLVPPINENTQLEHTGLFDAQQLRRFTDFRLNTVREFLPLEPSDEQLGLSADQVDRWQAQLWLMMNVPTLRPEDACALVACGITEPEQLATSHAQQLFERLQRFLSSTQGRNTQWSNVTIDIDRISRWLRALEQTRTSWQHLRRPQRRARSFSPRTYQQDSQGQREQTPRVHRYDRQESQRRERTPAAQANESRYERAPREPQPARPPRMHSAPPNDRDAISRQNRSSQQLTAEETTIAPRMAPVRKPDSPAKTKPKTERKMRDASASKSSPKGLKFYLDLEDHIEAAPSIGPKTAERFEKIGVITVSDFLKQTAESMATKLNYKRLSAGLLRQWQHQARLVCRVPNLRGHDAQLLVACEVIEPEELATMQPTSLFEVIGPFSSSKEGMKIIRNGKKPDIEEITDWISWAADTRSLQAA